MQINKTIGQFVHYSKDMDSAGKHRTVWIILLLALFSNGAYAFSVGAVQGLNCGAIYQPTCTYAAGLAFYETVHQNITEDALIQPSVAFTPPGGAQSKFKYKHRIQIEDANMETDFDQSNHDKHFDNEQFSLGEKRLDDLEFIILWNLKKKTVIDVQVAGNLRSLFGGYLHTLQDFFAHSSWVNSHPGTQDVPTFWAASVNLTPTVTGPCIDLDSIISPWDPDLLAKDNPLTTGYAGSTSSLLIGFAPYGKCGHGLVGNGIHKDWTGRDFHPEARAQAVYASAEAAKYIINYPDNNPDNVCMFMTDKPCIAKTNGTVKRLNDTGITTSQCYMAGSDALVACNSTGAIALSNAQDGMTGRDADTARNNSTDGKLGFSFAAVTGGCVQDNVTGLMWEVKTTDGGLRDWSKTYINYGDNHAGDASAYPAAVNATNLCGYNDWRLPTVDELQSIVDYGVAYPGPTVDATWFPNTQGNAFWSASPVVGYSFSVAWTVNFSYGNVYGNSRSFTNYVRLVRAGQ